MGKIVDIYGECTYGILVEFNNNEREYYTIKGKRLKRHKFPEIYKKNPFDLEDKPPIPEQTFEKDELVWVSMCDNINESHLRYYSHMDEDGDHRCFLDGKTSKTTDEIVYWNYCWKYEERKDKGIYYAKI